jgi:hypothetical protein
VVVAAYLELWVDGKRDRIALTGERVTIGHSSETDVSLGFDPAVSRLHAVLENLGAGWCIRDLDSRNGTFVNGERLWGERPLRPGDEIRVGQTRLMYTVDAPGDDTDTTAAAEKPPELTRRERDVLLALCAPLVSDDPFKEPASIRAIARELFITEAAVKQHLLRLYDKFRIYEEGERRRARLANEAVRKGAVTMAELLERARHREAN